MQLKRFGAGAPLVVVFSLGAFPVTAEHKLQDPVARLDVLLTTAPGLSGLARASMTTEAAAIWRRQGVAIEWLTTANARPVGGDRLRVLVVPRRPQIRNPDEPFPVGELVRPAGSHPVALISIEGAQHLIASMRGRAGYELVGVDERRLGVVLGRALAHEIGHYLLGTHTHARSGLMRPTFSAHEFCDLRDDTFALDADAAAWLRTRDADKFAYAR